MPLTRSAGLVAVAILAFSPAALAQSPDLYGAGYTLGDSAAPVHVVEFGDFACSACAGFWRETWPEVREHLIDTGRVRWTHVPFLLGFPRGDDAAAAAECAGAQGAFWTMHDSLFAGQREWTTVKEPEATFLRYAGAAGAELEAFARCLEDEGGKDRTRAAGRAARRARVRLTPTFFIDGRQAVGALRYEMFLGLVEEAESHSPGARR